MERTGLSIAGGILLLLASICTGIGGTYFAATGNLERLLPVWRAKMTEDDKAGKLKPEQKQQLETSFAEAEAKLADPEFRARLAKLKAYGYFEIAAALVGLIAAIAVLAATAFGRVAGPIGAVLGAATCVWALIIGAPAQVQGAFLIAYVVAFAGALALRPRAPTTI